MHPLVSIIVPTRNNEATIVRTLNSLIEQTLSDLEIVVVDDASSDMTVALCRDAQHFDSRIVLVPLEENKTALQARRIGVQHATATYIMFCDADDELEPQAAEEASSFALGGGYDVVHFATTIVSATGSKHTAWERALDPFGTELFGDEILLSSAFGRPGAKINGNVWSRLYERRLVEESWKVIDPTLRLPRAQDIYQTLLILAKAKRYGGLTTPLYRYNFGAGKSGNVANRDAFQHFLSSARTYQAVEEHVASENWDATSGFDPDEMLERLRDQFIENQLNYWFQLPRPADAALGDLLRTWGGEPVLKVLATRYAGKIRVIAEAFNKLDASILWPVQMETTSSGPQHIALLGNISGSGGVQKVMAAQAELLTRAGHSVTVLSFDHEPETRVHQFPSSVVHRTIGPRGGVASGVTGLIQSIYEGKFTLLLNHDNYTHLFPWVAAVTRTLGVTSALFLHSFSLRAFHDFREVFGYLPEIAKSYDITVTLSEADRMWWEASGVPRVRTLPNFGPGSLADATAKGLPMDSGEGDRESLSNTSLVDLLWVGRLQDDTKNVSGLLEAFARIVSKRPSTTLAIVGGEPRSGESARFEQMAERLGVREQVHFVGQVQDVETWYNSAKVFLATSSIEGFNLALVEAQGCGLPIAMYDLPYLEAVSGNPGIVSVEWGATELLADAVLSLLEAPERAEKLGAAGRDFARRFSLENYEANLQSIIRELEAIRSSATRNSGDNAIGATTAVVPTSVMGELYRLYERIYRSKASQLQTAKRENSDLRKNLAQLKRTLADSKAQHQRVENAIAQIEKKKQPASPQKKIERPVVQRSSVRGVWPLWARQGTQPFDAPLWPVFEDVSVTDPVVIPAAWALDCGLLGSTASSQFKGGSKVTRGEFIRMLYRLAGSPEQTSETASYRDLDPSDPATAWAIQTAILRPGRPNKRPDALPAWNPDSFLRRRSAAMLLYRAAGSPKYHAPNVSPYADLTVNQKFYKEMCWVAHQGILPSSRKEDAVVFDQHQIMTLAETVSALFRQMVGPIAMRNSR